MTLRWAESLDEAAALEDWLGRHVPHIGPAGVSPAVFGGVWRGGGLRAVVAFHEWQAPERTLQVSIAGLPGWATRGVVRAMFSYAFETCGAWLLWATMPAEAHDVRSFNRKLGFSEDGRLRDRFGRGAAAVVASVTRDEWLDGPWR